LRGSWPTKQVSAIVIQKRSEREREREEGDLHSRANNDHSLASFFCCLYRTEPVIAGIAITQAEQTKPEVASFKRGASTEQVNIDFDQSN
jgi:hypothetical protein